MGIMEMLDKLIDLYGRPLSKAELIDIDLQELKICLDTGWVLIEKGLYSIAPCWYELVEDQEAENWGVCAVCGNQSYLFHRKSGEYCSGCLNPDYTPTFGKSLISSHMEGNYEDPASLRFAFKRS
jgi:hypothetical protein